MTEYIPWAFSKLDFYFFLGGKVETDLRLVWPEPPAAPTSRHCDQRGLRADMGVQGIISMTWATPVALGWEREWRASDPQMQRGPDAVAGTLEEGATKLTVLPPLSTPVQRLYFCLTS